MELPQEYQTPIGHGDSRTFGEALLAPSVIYVAFVRECQRRGLKLNYVAHVTGHGWRKLMRLEEPFVYEIACSSSRLASWASVPSSIARAAFCMLRTCSSRISPSCASR